jgi:hypothetical protein
MVKALEFKPLSIGLNFLGCNQLFEATFLVIVTFRSYLGVHLNSLKNAFNTQKVNLQEKVPV